MISDKQAANPLTQSAHLDKPAVVRKNMDGGELPKRHEDDKHSGTMGFKASADQVRLLRQQEYNDTFL